jgi:hypothetical protein
MIYSSKANPFGLDYHLLILNNVQNLHGIFLENWGEQEKEKTRNDPEE